MFLNTTRFKDPTLSLKKGELVWEGANGVFGRSGLPATKNVYIVADDAPVGTRRVKVNVRGTLAVVRTTNTASGKTYKDKPKTITTDATGVLLTSAVSTVNNTLQYVRTLSDQECLCRIY
jgi:hypothetical protein